MQLNLSQICTQKSDLKYFSITKILKELNFDTLEERQIQAKLTMAYKILNGLVILDSDMLPKFNNKRPFRECNSVKVGTENRLEEPNSNIQTAESTFFFSVPKFWNHRVTPMQADAKNVDSFKRFFQKK